MIKFLFFLNFLFILGFTKAQNIIDNGSFEEYEELSKDIIYPISWIAPNNSSIDYYSSASVMNPEYKSLNTPSVNIANSTVGNHKAHHGIAYIGLFICSWGGGMEHFCGRISQPMQKDSLYEVSFAIKYPSDIFWLYSRKFEILFTHEELNLPTTDYPFLFENNKQSLKASLVFNIDSVNKTREWVKYTSYYMAIGGEQYITLGLFGQDDEKLNKTIKQFNKNTLDYPSQVKFVETHETELIRANPQSKRYRRDYQSLNIAYYLFDDFGISPANNNAVEFTY